MPGFPFTDHMYLVLYSHFPLPSVQNAVKDLQTPDPGGDLPVSDLFEVRKRITVTTRKSSIFVDRPFPQYDTEYHFQSYRSYYGSDIPY